MKESGKIRRKIKGLRTRDKKTLSSDFYSLLELREGTFEKRQKMGRQRKGFRGYAATGTRKICIKKKYYESLPIPWGKELMDEARRKRRVLRKK